MRKDSWFRGPFLIVLSFALFIGGVPPVAAEERDGLRFEVDRFTVRAVLETALREAKNRDKAAIRTEADTYRIRAAIQSLIHETDSADELLMLFQGLQQAKRSYADLERFDFRLLRQPPPLEAPTTGNGPVGVASPFAPSGFCWLVNVALINAARNLMSGCVTGTEVDGEITFASEEQCREWEGHLETATNWFLGPGLYC